MRFGVALSVRTTLGMAATTAAPGLGGAAPGRWRRQRLGDDRRVGHGPRRRRRRPPPHRQRDVRRGRRRDHGVDTRRRRLLGREPDEPAPDVVRPRPRGSSPRRSPTDWSGAAPPRLAVTTRLARVPLPPDVRRLVASYACAGFGYVITATYLVLIVRDSDLGRSLEVVTWCVVGAFSAVSTWLVARVGADRRAPAIVIAHALQAAGVLAAAFVPGTAGVLVGGGAARGHVRRDHRGGRRLRRPHPPRRPDASDRRDDDSVRRRADVGPAVGGWLADLTGTFRVPSVLAAVVLLAGGGDPAIRTPAAPGRCHSESGLMTLHRQTAELLAAMAALGLPRHRTRARRRCARNAGELRPSTELIAEVRDLDADGVPRRLYRPAATRSRRRWCGSTAAARSSGTSTRHDDLCRAPTAAASACSPSTTAWRPSTRSRPPSTTPHAHLGPRARRRARLHPLIAVGGDRPAATSPPTVANRPGVPVLPAPRLPVHGRPHGHRRSRRTRGLLLTPSACGGPTTTTCPATTAPPTTPRLPRCSRTTPARVGPSALVITAEFDRCATRAWPTRRSRRAGVATATSTSAARSTASSRCRPVDD